MSEETQQATEGSVLAPKAGETLAEHTFTDGRGRSHTRQVYPEISKFFTSRKEAEQTYNIEYRKASRARQVHLWEKEDEWYANPENRNGSFDEYSAGRRWDRDETNHESQRAVSSRYSDFTNAHARRAGNRTNADNPNSWEILRTEAAAAGHKVVVWIIDNCMDNEHEALQILHYLPATPDELWKAAKEDHDMCQVFDSFMAKAEAAGILGPEDIPGAMREMQALNNYISRNYGSSYTREIKTRILPVVKANAEYEVKIAREAWEKELLERYAASKDMTELLRSLADGHPLIQTHLNRSDAAKAAWDRRRGEVDSNEEVTVS